jgi:hypothetical protein
MGPLWAGPARYAGAACAGTRNVLQCTTPGGGRAQIGEPLDWDDDNISHLLDRHNVLVEEVEEILLGVAGEDPSFLFRRDGDHYKIYGETGDAGS